MSRMLKPAAAGLAISSLCLSFAGELPAQNAAKKKAPVKQVQAVDDRPADAGGKGNNQAPPENGKPGQIARPPVQPLVVDPALEKVLKDWENKTSQFKKLVGEFESMRYDPTFMVEKRAKGKFAHEAPDKGSYEKEAVPIAKGQPAGKKGYALESDTPEKWVCTGKEIIKINENDKTYEKLPIPPESQGENIIEGPLPFLFGMKAKRAKERYKLKLMDKSTEQEIWLEVIPRYKQDSTNWVRAIVIIDAIEYVPTSVRLYDPTEAFTTHIFKNVQVNPKKTIIEFFGGNNPFAPRLRGYKQVNSGDKASPGERLTPPSNPAQSSAPAAKGRVAADDFDRGAGVAEAPPPRKKAADHK